MTDIFMPRGIRNNNPGNIRLSKTKWDGQKPLQADLDFIEFLTPLHGLRALMKLLTAYYTRHGLDTVASIINRYAPPHENATDHYAHHVAKIMGVRRSDVLDLKHEETMVGLARAIVIHENGVPPESRPQAWYDEKLYREAAQMVLPVNA